MSTAPQEAGLHSNKMLKEPAFLWQALASSSHNSRRAFYGLGRGWGHKAGEGHPTCGARGWGRELAPVSKK